MESLDVALLAMPSTTDLSDDLAVALRRIGRGAQWVEWSSGRDLKLPACNAVVVTTTTDISQIEHSDKDWLTAAGKTRRTYRVEAFDPQGRYLPIAFDVVLPARACTRGVRRSCCQRRSRLAPTRPCLRPR